MLPPTVSGAQQKDWFWIEAGLLVATLVGGAVLRYWLSTVVPFDAGEVALLAEATDPERPLRVPFIMLNGVSLFVLYVVVRRSAGVSAAFAALLALQSSLSFQLEAMRVRWYTPAVLITLFVVAYIRLMRPGGQLPAKINRALIAGALVLGLGELYLLATLPRRMVEIRRESRADPATLVASFTPCATRGELPLARFTECPIAWPKTRSVEQQEALWEHQRRLGGGATAVATAGDLPPVAAGRVVLLDQAGAGFLVVPEGPLLATARRMLLTTAP
ncbi:MAG: hypothetical protein L6Q84_34700 [Polyangiaceae bacterium]|nr:hypothetical protein [Polyangiaceae bacterium]